MTDPSPRFARRDLLRAGRDIALGLGVAAAVATPAGCGGGGAPPAPPSGRKPNVVVFLVDDLGVMDCGHCGSEFYRTPNMDRMAADGVRFTQAYSPSPLCSSSRAAILTGKYPHRLGITGAIDCSGTCAQVDAPSLPAYSAAWQKVVTPSYLTQLPLGERTLAERLADDGYATALIGKWHLGGAGYSPREQGFQHVVGGGHEGAPYVHFDPYGLEGIPTEIPGEYLADRLTREAERFIQQNRERPFFLFLSHFGVHVPLNAPEHLIRKYRALRDPASAQRNANYAGMVESIDTSLGHLRAQLESLGLSDDTLVIVTSDNGGLLQTAIEAYLLRVTSAGPFRGGKAHIYEGGIRVPFIVQWGSRIRRGVVSDAVVTGMDIVPTVMQAAGLDVPETDGRSLLAHLQSGENLPDRATIWHFPHSMPLRFSPAIAIDEQARASIPATAVRHGDYKLVRLYGEGATNADAAEELYDLAADPGEVHNVARLFPDVVAALGTAIDENLGETGALVPVANSRYRERQDGWRVTRQATGTMAHGFLRVTATGSDPQMVGSKLNIREQATVIVRARSGVRVSLALYHSFANPPSFSSGQRTILPLAGGDAFRELRFPLPASSGSAVQWLRLDPGSTGAVVDIDEIRIVAAADEGRELAGWRFNGVNGLPWGGSWFSETDTFVACGPGSLQIDLAGPAPTIISPPVTLFAPLRIQLRMRSTGAGDGLVACTRDLTFGSTALDSATLPLLHDGNWHDYEVLIGSGDTAIQRLRIGLGHGIGTAEIDAVRVFDTQDSLLLLWEFCATA